MKQWIAFAALGLLAGCSWFHHKPRSAPPSEYIVTGAPTGALILLDSASQGEALKGRAQVFTATPGYHLLEVKVGDGIIYREQTYLNSGEHQVVHVLSPG